MVTSDEPSQADEPTAIRRAHRVLFWITLVLAVAGGAFGYVVLSDRPAPPSGLLTPVLVGTVAQLAATIVIGRSRARPHLGLLAVLLVAALMYLLDSPWQLLVGEGGVLWVPLALSWSSARVAERASARWEVAASAAAVLAYAVLAGAQAEFGLGASLAAIAPVLGGVATVLARRLGQARRDRAEALTRERVAVERQEQAAERERLSADMHDNLGHVLTLLVLHANALAVSGADPGAREAGRRIGELGGSGMAELRRLLALLEDPDSTPERPGAEGAESVADLVEQVREAGQAVEFADAGTERDLPAVLARTVHRVVQEGLTNARRHAPGATAEVVVRDEDGAVRVSVRNGPGGPGEPGAGRGLDGLRRRVELLGGEVRAEPREDGGFALHATLPATVVARS